MDLIQVFKAGERVPFLIFLATNWIEEDRELELEYEDTTITLSSEDWDYYTITEMNSESFTPLYTFTRSMAQ